MVKDTLKDRFDRFRWRTQMRAKCFWQNTKTVTQGTVKWVVKHPVEGATIATAVATVAGIGYKSTSKIVKHIANAHEEKERKRKFYDPKKWNWVKTKRELTGREIAEFDRRRAKGESVSAILSSMGVLK